MHIVALKSPDSSDHRSVIHPETIAKLVSLEGASVSFESGIGHGINVSDKAFAELGLKAISRDECLSNGDLIITPSSLTLTESASIKKGEVLSQENIKVVRPSYGLHPKFFTKILGKKAKKNIKFAERITIKKIVF